MTTTLDRTLTRTDYRVAHRALLDAAERAVWLELYCRRRGVRSIGCVSELPWFALRFLVAAEGDSTTGGNT